MTAAEARGRRALAWYDTMIRDMDMVVSAVDETDQEYVRMVAERHLDRLSVRQIAERHDYNSLRSVYLCLARGYAYIGDTLPRGAWDISHDAGLVTE